MAFRSHSLKVAVGACRVTCRVLVARERDRDRTRHAEKLKVIGKERTMVGQRKLRTLPLPERLSYYEEKARRNEEIQDFSAAAQLCRTLMVGVDRILADRASTLERYLSDKQRDKTRMIMAHQVEGFGALCTDTRLRGQIEKRKHRKLMREAAVDRAVSEDDVIGVLMPNPSVERELSELPAVTYEEILRTRAIVEEQPMNGVADEAAALVLLSRVAVKRDMFCLVREPRFETVTRDSCQHAVQFAMFNDTLTENSLFLLGSDRPEHQVKGYTLRLTEKPEDVGAKLAALHGVQRESVVLVSERGGPLRIDYIVRGAQNWQVATGDGRVQFGERLVSICAHAALRSLELNPKSFDRRCDRDYRVQANCPRGEFRGEFRFLPPAGWYCFGLQLGGRFGDDAWFGEKGPGAWPVAYCGTSHRGLHAIMGASLKVGRPDPCAAGVYCSPKAEIALGYSEEPLEIVDGHGAKRYFKYVLMCRVNAGRVHCCSEAPCSKARDTAWTLHMTLYKDYWFVNVEGEGSSRIRTCGVLAREVTSEGKPVDGGFEEWWKGERTDFDSWLDGFLRKKRGRA